MPINQLVVRAANETKDKKRKIYFSQTSFKGAFSCVFERQLREATQNSSNCVPLAPSAGHKSTTVCKAKRRVSLQAVQQQHLPLDFTHYYWLIWTLLFRSCSYVSCESHAQGLPLRLYFITCAASCVLLTTELFFLYMQPADAFTCIFLYLIFILFVCNIHFPFFTQSIYVYLYASIHICMCVLLLATM